MMLDPQYWERSYTGSMTGGVVVFPGTGDNFLSTPDAPALDIVGDICIVARVAADDWTPTANKTILAKRIDGTTNSYRLHLTSGGLLQWAWSPDGTDASQLLAASTVIVGAQDRMWQWIAATLDVDNGAAGKTARFWLSNDGATWAPLGDPVTTAGTTSIFSGSAPLQTRAGTSPQFPWIGNISHLSLRNGIGPGGTVGGTEVFRFDGHNDLQGVAENAASFEAASGQIVTVNRSGSPATQLVRPRWNEVGHDHYIGPVNVPDGMSTIRSALA